MQTERRNKITDTDIERIFGEYEPHLIHKISKQILRLTQDAKPGDLDVLADLKKLDNEAKSRIDDACILRWVESEIRHLEILIASHINEAAICFTSDIAKHLKIVQLLIEYDKRAGQP